MRLVAINTALLDKYKNDSEILTKSKRPYVLVIRLKYKAKNMISLFQYVLIFLHLLQRNNILHYLPVQVPVPKIDMDYTT